MAEEDDTESLGIDIFYGTAGAEAASITTAVGGIDDLGDLAGFTGGEKIKTTKVNQTSRVNTYRPGYIDPTPLSFVLSFKASNIADMMALKMVTKAFKITFDDAPEGGTATTIHGDGFITEFKITGKKGDMAKASVTVQPMDEWEFTEAAPAEAPGGGA
jgi:hypothetical protein